MTKIYSGAPHLNGNLMAAIDFETTGRRPGYHEPIQIAIVPLDAQLRPIEGIIPFNYYMKPKFPERAEPQAMRVNRIDLDALCVSGLSTSRVEDLLIEWFERLELPFKKCLVPLAHNWAFEWSFLMYWLGPELTSKLFHAHAHDAMSYANSLNMKAFFEGEKPPFTPSLSLTSMCKTLGVVNQRPHDALSDCIAEAEVYRRLLQVDVF